MGIDAALIQASHLAKLPRPDQSNLDFLRGWLIGEKEGGAFLKGSEFFTWDIPNGSEKEQLNLAKDLISIHAPTVEEDMFSQQIISKLVDWYHLFWGSRSKVSGPSPVHPVLLMERTAL